MQKMQTLYQRVFHQTLFTLLEKDPCIVSYEENWFLVFFDLLLNSVDKVLVALVIQGWFDHIPKENKTYNNFCEWN
jgi:hypothetical protein